MIKELEESEDNDRKVSNEDRAYYYGRYAIFLNDYSNDNSEDYLMAKKLL